MSIQEVNQDNNQGKVQVQTPVVHTQKRDRQREKSQAVNQTPVYKPELQREAPTTHDRDYNGVRNEYIDRYARKPREHLKTWSARLHRRWVKVANEECDLPQNLKEC